MPRDYDGPAYWIDDNGERRCDHCDAFMRPDDDDCGACIEHRRRVYYREKVSAEARAEEAAEDLRSFRAIWPTEAF